MLTQVHFTRNRIKTGSKLAQKYEESRTNAAQNSKKCSNLAKKPARSVEKRVLEMWNSAPKPKT